MKVCILTHTLPRFEGDPSAPFIDELTKALVKLGHNVLVLTPYNPKIDRKFKRPYKLITYKYIFPDGLHLLGYSQTLKGDRSMNLWQYFLSPFMYLFGFMALLKLVRKENVDIISSHWIIPNGFIAAMVEKLTKTSFVTTIPGSDVYMAGKNPFFRWMANFAAKNAGCVISDSAHYLKQLNALSIYPKKTETIRYGVDVNKFKPETKWVQHQPTILTVGRMVAKKGFIYLIRALPKIVERIPNVRLIMVGSGEEEITIKSLAKDLKVYENISFAGMVSFQDLPNYYKSADVFVMPSIRDEKGNIDASPVSMMEAMSCGLPVVATSFAGGKDLVIEGKTGYLVKEKDSTSIAGAVVKLLSNGRDKLKKTVRGVAVSNFSSEIIAKKYTECFKNSILAK